MEKQPHQEYRDDLADELKGMRSKGDDDLAKNYSEYKKNTTEYEDSEKLHRLETKNLEGLSVDELVEIGKAINTDEKWAEIINTKKLSVRDLFDRVFIDVDTGFSEKQDAGKFNGRMTSNHKYISNPIEFNAFNKLRGKNTLEAFINTYLDVDDTDFSSCTAYELKMISEWFKDDRIYEKHISTLKNSGSESEKEEQRQTEIRVAAKKMGI